MHDHDALTELYQRQIELGGTEGKILLRNKKLTTKKLKSSS